MKKQIFFMVVLLLLTLTSCKNSPEAVEVPENEIIVISRNLNYAWGYQDMGFFITSNGNVYSFNFSQDMHGKSSYNPDKTFMQKLNLLMEYTEPFVVVDMEYIQKLYSYILKLDVDDTFRSKSVACDAGSSTLQFNNVSENKLILCRESGDNQGELKSRAAKNLLYYFDNTVMPVVSDATSTKSTYTPNFLYTDEDVYFYNINCGYTGKEGTYIIKGKKDVQEIKETIGIDLTDFKWSGEFPSDSYVYFMEIVDVSNTGYDLKSNGVIVKDGEISFLRDPNSKVPEEGKEYGQAMNGFCFVAEVPKCALQTADN